MQSLQRILIRNIIITTINISIIRILTVTAVCKNYPPQEAGPRCTPWRASARPRSWVPARPATILPSTAL